MVRAMVMVWLFAGLRSDEIYRLSVGCARWQREDVMIPGTSEELPKDVVCFLDVPVNKTATAFTKPVDRVVGEAIKAWECERPEQPKEMDPKTRQWVSFLFSYRAKRVGKAYINKAIIPMLCQKAGVPIRDARGKITSHRARSTIASQLYNSKDPMTLFELQQWLGHRLPSSTTNYVLVTPTRQAKSFANADYFKRNLRLISVLLDKDAILNGAAAAGESWEFYDLGHGYCTYDFFVQCPLEWPALSVTSMCRRSLLEPSYWNQKRIC
jgi:integrase